MTFVLYVTRNGLLEPLGQSQVFAYLRGLSSDYGITLLTYEKPDDWSDLSRMAQVRSQCQAYGIRWRPRKFRQKPRMLASILNLLGMGWLSFDELRGGRAGLIHARSYLPAFVAWGVGKLTGVPFIFDMRALWPEELITAGRLRRGSWVHRALCHGERLCLRDAAAVVSLTSAAVENLRHVYPAETAGQTIEVIPTCTDLDRFTPAEELNGSDRAYGCVGTVLSGWFRTDWLAMFFEVAARHDGQARFEVITRDDEAAVRAAVDPKGVLGTRLAVYAMSPQEIHTAVQKLTACVMFYASGAISELGRSPTRLGEALGCGVPIVANRGVGDVAEIIEDNQVGVLAEAGDSAAMERAYQELQQCRDDAALTKRCRETAERIYSLERGVAAYRALYAAITGPEDQRQIAQARRHRLASSRKPKK